mgnify:CR=1 FL=1
MSTSSTKANSTIRPTKWIVPSTFLLIGFPLIHSIPTKTILAPSKAGNGKRLNTDKLIDIKGILDRNNYEKAGYNYWRL